MSCGEWQDLTTKLLWLSGAQIVFFMVAGFLALHWRGQWLNEKRKNRTLPPGLLSKLAKEVQRAIWESDEDFSECPNAALMRVRKLVKELQQISGEPEHHKWATVRNKGEAVSLKQGLSAPGEDAQTGESHS